jgi:hypothetical protein
MTPLMRTAGLCGHPEGGDSLVGRAKGVRQGLPWQPTTSLTTSPAEPVRHGRLKVALARQAADARGQAELAVLRQRAHSGHELT